MTSEIFPEDDELQSVFDHEALIMRVAHSDIVRYPPITLFAPDQATRMLRDYSTFLEHRSKLSRKEAESMVQNDLQLVIDKLRAKFITYSFIGPVRSAVLLHVALFLGIEALEGMTALFDALRAKNYDEAYRQLMLSAWPGLVGTDTIERLRVLNLAEQMRTGVLYDP